MLEIIMKICKQNLFSNHAFTANIAVAYCFSFYFCP